MHHHNLIAAAADCGVTHVVALSGLDADQRSPFCYAVGNGYTEQMLRDSGCGFSIARASIYTEFLLAFVTTARAGGQLRLPAGDGQISPVCRGDVGRCLAALAIGPPTGRHHDITGPDALSLAAIAEIASRAWQSSIVYLSITPAAYQTELAAAGETHGGPTRTRRCSSRSANSAGPASPARSRGSPARRHSRFAPCSQGSNNNGAALGTRARPLVAGE